MTGRRRMGLSVREPELEREPELAREQGLARGQEQQEPARE
jgi:hypothetical protein